MSFPLTQNPGGSEPGPLAVPKTNTIPGTSVPSGAQTGAPNPYTQYGASVRAVNDVQSLHATNLIKIKDKYRNAKLFNPSQPDEDREIGAENKRYAADLSRAKGFEAQMINQVRKLTMGNITGWLFGDGSDGTTRDVMLKNLSVFNTNGEYKASRSKVSVIADKVAKELGGDDYLKTFLTNEMSAEIDRIHAGIGVKKTAASILSSQRFATFVIDKDGNITSILQDQLKNSIDATKKVDLDNTLKSYRQTATYNIRKEQEEASLTFLKPKLDELQAKYTPVLEDIGTNVSSRYVEKVNKELSEYGVYLQEEVKAGRMKYSTAVSQLRMAETNANNELKRSEKKIQQETQDIFDNSPMGKEYQSAVAQVRSEFKNMASAITKKHNGLYLMQAKPLVNSYNEYVKQIAANLDALQAKELVAIQKAYNSAGDQYAAAINNYYKSKKTIDIFTDNVVANIGNLLKGIGYKLESSGITGELVDNMKYGGQDAFNRFVIQTPELSLKNFAEPKVAAGAMSQLAYALPGLVTGIASGGIGLGANATQYIAGTAAWLSNSMMMQGDTRDQALQNGFTESDANDAARKMGIQQLAYLPVAFMSANVLFGKISTLRSGVVKGALSTTGEWLQETTESGGQKVYVDPTQKTTFAEAFMRHDTQMEGVTAAYTQLVMNTASLLLRGLVKFPGVKFGRNKAVVHAPDIQHVASAINNTGNESTSDMVLEFMEDEGAVTPEVAEAHRARFETAKRRLQSAKDAGMNDEQAQLYVSAKQDLDDKRQALGDIGDSEIKAVAEKEIQELEKKIQGIIDGSVPVVTLSVQGMTLAMTPEDAEQSVEDPLVVEAIASGDVEMTGPEDVVAKLREVAAALSASNAPVGDVEMAAPQENVGNIAIIPNTENNGQRQEGQEDGRQDVLSPPEPITAEPAQPGPVDMIVDSPAVVGEADAAEETSANAPSEPAVVEETPKKKRTRSKKVAEAQVNEQAEPVVSDVAPEVVTPEAASFESTPVEEVAPSVQEVKAAPVQVKADAKPLSEMTAKEKKDEGKKYIKSIDDYFSKVFPALGIGKPDVAQIKSKSLTGKYNKALDLLRNEAITSDEFDAIKKRLLAAADKSGATIAEAAPKDDYMEGVRKEIEEKKKEGGGKKIKAKPKTFADEVMIAKEDAARDMKDGTDASTAMREVAKKIREKAKKANKGEAYESLLGLPIAAYQATLNLIANLLEAGATITEAINAGAEYVKAQLQGEKFSDAEIRQALVANLNDIGIIENQEPGDIKKQIDSQYPTQYTNAKGKVITRSPIIRAQMSLKDLAKKSFSQGARAVDAVKELQKLLRNNIELYGLKKFSLGTFKKMIAILQSIGPDYDATDVYDLVAGIDDALLYEANLDKVKEINKKLRQVKQLIRSGIYVKSSYETALADVFAFAVSPFKVLKYANDPVVALFEYEKTLDAIIKGFGSRQGFRGFDKNDLLDWAEKMKATEEEIAIAEENEARSRFDELVKSDKYKGTKNYEEYVNEQKVIKDQEQEEKKAQRLVDSRDAVVNYQRVISLMQDILRNKIASGDFSYDKFIEDVAREIAAVDTNKLIRQEGFTERQEQMDENAEHMRRLSQLNDILNNILHDGDVNEAYAFIDKYITTPDAIKEMTAEAVKVRPITNPDKKNITNLINSMFFNKKFNILFRLKLYQGFAFMMNRAKNIYYGIEGSGKDGVAKQFAAIIGKHLGNDITDLSRYKLGVVNMLIQYAREAGDETAAERFDKAVTRIIDIEINKMATYADGAVNPNMGRKFNKSYEMTRKAIDELGLMIPNPSSVFMDSNGTLAPLIAMLNDGERELNNFMYAELNNPNYVNALKNSASANMGIDFEAIENYFPMYVYTFQGEPKVVGLNIGNMTRNMNGMRRMYVRPSDRNKKRSALAGEDKYYSMDAFTNFLSAYYEGLSQIHAGREAMKMQYLLNSPQFQGIMGGALNRMLGFTKKSNATANIDIMNDKIQEVFDDYMRPMGIYSNFDSTMSKVFDWAKDAMMGVYLKHPAQAWNQYVPNAAAVMIQVGPTYFYGAIRAQSLAIVGSDSDKAAYRDFMANFTVSHRSTMGVIDDVSKQIQTSRLRKILGNAIDSVSEKVLLGFTLQYSDSAIANATTIASYIKSLVEQGIINSPSEFTVTMMQQHAVRPNMIALTRAEAETTEINNSSLKEERASIVKDNKYKQPAIGTQEKIDRNLQFAYMLKGFAMNSYMHMRDAMKRLSSGANATPDDKVEAAREMFASISQIFIFNALKVGVTGPLYTMIGVAIYSALMGSKPDEETEDERTQRMSAAWWRFVLNTFFDGMLGGSSAILEGLAKFTVGQGADQGIKAYIDKEKAGGKEATLPYFYMDIKTPPQTGEAKLNYNVNPYGKVANRYREPFMGSVEPAFDIAKSVWEMTPIGFEENKKLNDEGNELLFKAKLSMIAAIMFRSGGLDRLEGQFEKALKNDPKYKKASSGGRSSGGGPFNKTFGGSAFGKTFGN